MATAADRAIHKVSVAPPFALSSPSIAPNDSPTLSCAAIHNRYLLTTTMSGLLVLYDVLHHRVLDTRRDHQKYVVKVACHPDPSGAWVTTAGWDSKILLYRLALDMASSETEAPELGEPVASLHLPTLPEAVLFIQHPEINTRETPVLLLSRRASTVLYYYTQPSAT